MIILLLLKMSFAEEVSSCSQQYSAQDMVALLNESEDSFRKMNTDSFQQNRQQALANLPCINEPISPGQAAHLHRIEVLHSFIVRDMALLGAHSRAAYQANPNSSVLQGAIQEGHPLDVLSSFAVKEAVAPTEILPRPVSGKILIDGKQERSVPTDLPYVFQIIKPNGEAKITQLVPLGGDAPSYPTWRGNYIKLTFEPRLTIAATTVAAAAITTASIAHFQEQKFWNPSTSTAELDAIRKTNNQLSIVSLVLGASSAGLLLGAGLVGSW